MAPSNRGTVLLGRALATPTIGSLVVLLVFCAIFSLSTDTFLAAGNLSLVIQQSVIVGTLAIGQTMIILTAGIDLANGSIAVLGTIVAGRLVNEGNNAALMPVIRNLAVHVRWSCCRDAGEQADVAPVYRHTRFAWDRHRCYAPVFAGWVLPGN